MDNTSATKEEFLKKTKGPLTRSQVHFVKRNIFEEEMKELRKQFAEEDGELRFNPL